MIKFFKLKKLKTMKRHIIVVFLILFGANIIHAQEIKSMHKDSLNVIVSEYYELNLKIFQANSTIDDIDNVFKLFTEDFTYVHPKYGGIYTREDLYNGYVRNQKNGGYDGNVVDIKIVNKIIGLNAVTVEKKFITKSDDGIIEGEPEMTLFEFKEGKIVRIFEYW